jgi:hypothetical protein
VYCEGRVLRLEMSEAETRDVSLQGCLFRFRGLYTDAGSELVDNFAGGRGGRPLVERVCMA